MRIRNEELGIRHVLSLSDVRFVQVKCGRA